MAFVRLLVFALVGLTVVYWSLSLYSASLRRERLEDDYDANPVPGQTREAYVAAGMATYRKGLRPKLLLGVYVVPIVVVSVIIYVVNNN
ncbi:hypothetical protein SAMN05428995_104214 [Loktanella sp. DSM 29012]|uniref:Uncharacterized protein n=1 Tax=Loktanella gaetbuli TaxID=2881335 RepID=A0ABS8BX04_9RHOB|nr:MULTISPECIES: hypothetical protein [Loktanella]MCB5199971.1 hypothetical protein [Loktanella gaetbuli]SEQ42288.1 hypothetical protein SAMN05428995_104214 [Loktanella sp. DSM 29012]